MTTVQREPLMIPTWYAVKVILWTLVLVVGSQVLLYLGLAGFGWVLELVGK